MWGLRPSPQPGVTPGLYHFLFERLQNLELYSFIIEPFPKCSEY